MASIIDRIKGASITQRAARSSVLTLLNFGTTQFIRLASNLILTRLLFPEAFGIMALATGVIVAIHQFSDIGVLPSIIRSKRGEEPLFLNTAWTLKIIRSIILWFIAWGISIPLSSFYNEPLLAQIIPFMALTMLIDALLPTKIEVALRKMQQGYLTTLEITSSIIGVLAMILMAWLMNSIWALPVGTVIGSAVKLLLFHFLMPGPTNRLAWDRDAVSELIHFGKWIFPATIATFIIFESDKFLIGRFVTMETLGIYNIGFFFASFPLMMARQLGGRVMVSFFKGSDTSALEEKSTKARKLMFTLFGGLALSVIPLVLIGDWLVAFLYDDRYLMAGVILVTLTAMNIPGMAQIPYQNAILALAHGRDYFLFLSIKAVFMVTSIWVGLEYYGLLGAIVGQGVAALLSYPAVLYFARKIRVYDPLFDGTMFAIAAVAIGLAWWLHADQITALIVV